MFNVLQDKLDNLKRKGIYRSLKVIEGEQGPRVKLDGKEVILLCSNNYLGLASHPALKEAAKKAIEQYGAGAGASRLISGTMSLHRELEEKIAAFKGTEGALFFNSGYHANLSVITTLIGRGDFVFSDKLNHASLIDGCILSRAILKRYPHKNLNMLENLLKEYSHSHLHNSRKLIITDGLFSMDGDVAPLNEALELADRYGAMLMVDDAHGIGVMGKKGRGTLEHLNIEDGRVIHMGTLGKAIGSFGAFVAGTKGLIELLINKARPFIYTTALPPSICASAMAAFDILEKEPERRKALWDRVSFFRAGLRDAGFNTLESEAQIIPIIIGDSNKTMEMSEELLKKGIFIQGIRPPTVPQGTGRLRITLMATHSYEDLKYALSVLVEAGRKAGVKH